MPKLLSTLRADPGLSMVSGVRVKRLLLEPLPVSQADRSGSRIPPLGRTDPDDVGV